MNVPDPGGVAEAEHPFISIVIVTYNSAGTIRECLDSVSNRTGYPHEIIVVDNSSLDDTTKFVAGYEQVIVQENDDNVGFAAACNAAALTARGRFLLFLNPDTVLLNDAVDLAAQYLDSHPDVGSVGATTFYEDGEVNLTCCFGEPTLRGALLHALGISRVFPTSPILNPDALGGWDRLTTREVGALTGCFLMLDNQLFKSLEGFDERFFMYSEDTDLSMRIRSSGRRCVHLHEAHVIHHGGRSDVVAADKMAKVLRARAQLYRKHWPTWRAHVGIALIDLAVSTRAVVSTLAAVLGRKRASSKWPDVWAQRSMWRHEPSR